MNFFIYALKKLVVQESTEDDSEVVVNTTKLITDHMDAQTKLITDQTKLITDQTKLIRADIAEGKAPNQEDPVEQEELE